MAVIRVDDFTPVDNNVLSMELTPCDGRKSFYGKAHVYYNGRCDRLILKSYSTNVCAFYDGEFYRLWEGYSATTLRHVNAFRALLGLSKISKSNWEDLPIERDF